MRAESKKDAAGCDKIALTLTEPWSLCGKVETQHVSVSPKLKIGKQFFRFIDKIGKNGGTVACCRNGCLVAVLLLPVVLPVVLLLPLAVSFIDKYLAK